MKNLFTPILAVLFLLLSFSSSLAGPSTIINDVLKIPFTFEAPNIDGELDDVWHMSTATPMIKFENGPDDTVGVYSDHHAAFRVMWDYDYFYVFVEVVDQELDGSVKSEPWLSDCIELFIDGQNEKASSYDTNDVQWRYVYGEEPGGEDNGSNGPGDYAFTDTEIGYNFELRISADSLANYFPLEADHEIGFEISNADRDEDEGQQDVLHWWTTNGNTWQDASLFGTALLYEEPEISSVLNIPYTDIEPIIDGVFEEAEGWEVTDEISMLKLEGDKSPDTLWATWQDHMASFWAMWDENYFYVFVKVIDEELDGSVKSEPWLSDAIELFIDGQNEKASSYDTNDVQWRWVYGEEPGGEDNGSNGPGDWAFLDTDLGYNFELRISADSLANYFPLENDHEIGFEISNADRDEDEGQQDVLHWWTTNGNTWQDASLFGTALLIGGEDVSSVKRIDEMPTDYSLKQNYPNPFNPSTKIQYSIPKSEQVKLTVYDILGKEVAVLVDEPQNRGTYSVDFNAADLSSGIYLYELRYGSSRITKKMMLMK